MKKSELNKFIREEIISTLSEDIAAMEKELDAYDQKLDTVIKKKEEAGLEEKVAKTVDDVIDPAEYGLIGLGYLKGFNRPHKLNADELETLGRKVVKSLYKGDFDKAKAKFINKKDEGPKEKDPRYIAYLRRSGRDEYADELEKKITEEDKEPSDAEIKKNKSLAKAAEELAVLTHEMKSLAKKYSEAEGQEKEDLLKKLKSKTKLKKELDKILDK